MAAELGFDIGGTFTDYALHDAASGELHIHKSLTTPRDPAEGAMRGLSDCLAVAGICHEQLGHILHATTLVANILIEGRGARVGLLTTAGFRDILEMRTEQRYAIYDLFLKFPAPLSERQWRRGLRERTDRDGRVLETIDAEEIRRVLAEFRAGGVEALAVSFLHSYRNPSNERAAAAVIRAEWPEVPLSLSSEIAPEIREYPRTSTTVANAYVQPLLSQYLRRLETGLGDAGFGGRFDMMLSSGSITPLRLAAAQPIRLVESGPAAGVVAAQRYGQLAGRRNLISFDMGGTTAKVALIHDGHPAVAPNLEVARMHRFRRGSGYPLQFPAVEILETGAGGGSIAWADALGLLKVGPRSAGAQPGPAAYGFGGEQPTVTDANLTLGYLNADYFLGGEMWLDSRAAARAIDTIAAQFAWSTVEAAAAIHRLVNENMAAAAKIHVLEQGRDPRNYALICFGGAGPAHAVGVAEILGLSEIIVSPNAGVAAAIGLLLAPAAFDFAHSYPTLLEQADWAQVAALFAEMEARGRAMLREVGIADAAISISRAVDGRFHGQVHEIQIPLNTDLDALEPSALATQFREQYRHLYHYLPQDRPVELLTWRATVTGKRAPLQLPKLPRGNTDTTVAQKGERPAYFAGAGGWLPTPVYDRYRLTPGMELRGPVIIEERESTIVVPPSLPASVDDYGNVHIQVQC